MNLSNVTFSSLDLSFCKSYMRIEEDFTEDDSLISLYLQSAKQYIIDYTELTPEELDEYSVVCIVILKMVSDFHLNKTTYSNKLNTGIDPLVTEMLSKIRNYNV